MAWMVYLLCALTASMCAYLLVRGYRNSGASLLLWGSICFVGLALNNIVLVVDRMVLLDVDLTLLRMAPAVLAVCAMLYGLIWESE